MRLKILALSIFVVLPVSLLAQNPSSMGPEKIFGELCTLNHPVTADAKITITTDGTGLTDQQKKRLDDLSAMNPEFSIARDSDGRLRLNITVTRPDTKARGTTTIVIDPVLKRMMTWGRIEKKYVEIPMPAQECTSRLPDFTKLLDDFTDNRTTTERLPDKQINGMPAIGYRLEEKPKASPQDSATPPAPSSAVLWLSPDIGLPVEGSLNVPQEHSSFKFELTNVKTQDPGMATFNVPEGYTKVDIEEMRKQMIEAQQTLQHAQPAPQQAAPAPADGPEEP